MAHADSDKGFLQNLCGNKSINGELSFNGKSLAKIIKSPDLLGIQYNNDVNKSKLIEKLGNEDYKREMGSLAFIRCSDCHGVFIEDTYYGMSGHTIGSVYTEIKLSEISFEALKMSLFDAEMRVCSDTIPTQYAYIEGIAVSSNIFDSKGDFTYFHFNSELNCIIGSRGTGKTTLLEIIQSIIMPNSLKGESRNKALQKYASAVVFLKDNDTIYAIYSEVKARTDNYIEKKHYFSEIKVYLKKQTAMHFQVSQNIHDTEYLKRFLTSGYQQRQLFDYSRNSDKILEIVDDFINWKHNKDFQKIIKQINNRMSTLEELLKAIRKTRSNTNNSFVEYIEQYGYKEEIINLLNTINNQKVKLTRLRIQMIEELNKVLIGKVQLTLSKKINTSLVEDNIKNLSTRVQRSQNKYYEYFLSIKKCLERIYNISKYADSFNFYILLLNSNFSEIIKSYKLNEYINNNDLEIIRKELYEDDILTFLDDSLKLEYNINAGTKYNDNFRDNSQVSMGQNAVALLLLILNAAYNMNDNRPLLMDQPEDDLDNSYIYSTLVKEFRKSKQKRQIIISTHNPNIPVAADAENILVLRYNGKSGYLSNTGAIDSHKIANDVLEIMEGGKEAIKRRTEKYNAGFKAL